VPLKSSKSLKRSQREKEPARNQIESQEKDLTNAPITSMLKCNSQTPHGQKEETSSTVHEQPIVAPLSKTLRSLVDKTSVTTNNRDSAFIEDDSVDVEVLANLFVNENKSHRLVSTNELAALNKRMKVWKIAINKLEAILSHLIESPSALMQDVSKLSLDDTASELVLSLKLLVKAQKEYMEHQMALIFFMRQKLYGNLFEGCSNMTEDDSQIDVRAILELNIEMKSGTDEALQGHCSDMMSDYTCTPKSRDSGIAVTGKL
jgi:hypothetical protein